MIHLTRSNRAAVAFVLVLGSASALGCRSDDGGPAGTTTQTTSSTTVPYELCPQACATAKTCRTMLDLSACEAQCHKELEGTGTLITESALDYFQHLHDTNDDSSCTITSWNLWLADPFNLDAFSLHVAEPAVLDGCVQALAPCGDVDVRIVQSGCFSMYYRYAAERRADARTCFAVPCHNPGQLDRTSCMCSKQPEGEPWLGMPPPAPDSNQCPWSAQ